jgi:hypothetical protein
VKIWGYRAGCGAGSTNGSVASKKPFQCKCELRLQAAPPNRLAAAPGTEGRLKQAVAYTSSVEMASIIRTVVGYVIIQQKEILSRGSETFRTPFLGRSWPPTRTDKYRHVKQAVGYTSVEITSIVRTVVGHVRTYGLVACTMQLQPRRACMVFAEETRSRRP